jgi:hypothetical protein
MNFTNSWFDNSELKKNIHKYVDCNSVNIFLEIGSFEGAASCFISTNFLDKIGSTLTCIDPFDTSDSTSPVYSNIKSTFIKNISLTKNWNKVRLCPINSNTFFKSNATYYNFIYIDGSHLPKDVEYDLINSIKYCLPGGIIWLDDYLGNSNIKDTIDEIYMNNKDILTIIHSGYQIAFKKN